MEVWDEALDDASVCKETQCGKGTSDCFQRQTRNLSEGMYVIYSNSTEQASNLKESLGFSS